MKLQIKKCVRDKKKFKKSNTLEIGILIAVEEDDDDDDDEEASNGPK